MAIEACTRPYNSSPERWGSQEVTARTDIEHKQVLHSYAVWHVLRRLRQRNGSNHTTASQASVAHRHIAAAMVFLDWLTDSDLTLASCRLADLDGWMAETSLAQHGLTGHFVRWARRQRLTGLDFPATRWTGPTRVLDTEARWDTARRLLHDAAAARA